MIFLLNIFVMLILSLLTVSFLPSILPWGIVPLLPLFFLIGLVYIRKGVEPILLAALAGVFLDFFSAFDFGLYLGLFLLIAILIRILYQEEMRELSFGAYFRLGTIGLGVYFLIQLLMLHFGGATVLTTATAVSFAQFAIVNIVFIVLGYMPLNWYFDLTHKIEDSQKRR